MLGKMHAVSIIAIIVSFTIALKPKPKIVALATTALLNRHDIAAVVSVVVVPPSAASHKEAKT